MSNSTRETVEIPLTHGYIAIVDAVDADLGSFKWHALIKPSGTVYAKRTVHIPNSKARKEYLHRVILGRILGRVLLSSELVDHINRNGLDCRRENLRLASHSQNRGNQKTRSDSKSGLKGAWLDERGTWSSQITINGITRSLGRFDTAEAAHAAYVSAAKDVFGEFASDGE